MIKKSYSLTFVLICLLSASGCTSNQELLGSLSIHQSVEVLVALKTSGILALQEKSGTNKTEKYKILVAKEDYYKALEILKQYNLPNNEEDEFLKITNSSGFTPNLREISNLRLDKAMAIEAERLIKSLNNVVGIKVSIRANLVTANEFTNETAKPKATAIIKITRTPEENLLNFEGQVRKIILQVVPRINNEDINVNFIKVKLVEGYEIGYLNDNKTEVVQLTTVAPFPLTVPIQQKDKVRLFLAMLVGIFVLIGVMIGYLTSALVKRRTVKPKKMNTTAILEASIKPQSLVDNLQGQNRDKLPPGK